MAALASPYQSVPTMFRSRCEQSADQEAYRFRDGDQWPSMTWAETYTRVRALAAGLYQLGIGPEQRCAILSGTRVEWILADLAIQCAGGATTTIYPSNTLDECTHILTDSDSTIVFAEDAAQVAKLRQARKELPDVTRVITFDGPADDDWVLSLDQLEERGRRLVAERPGMVEELMDGVATGDLATLIYTSGTTGLPKGVRLTHANWLYVAEAVGNLGDDLLTGSDLQYLWLPLAHAFGKVLQVGQLRVGYPTAIDGDVNRIVDNLPIVRPTFMGAAPRIFEKVHSRIVSQAESGGRLRARIFHWASAVGVAASRRHQRGIEPGTLDRLRWKVADKLVFSTIRQRFGGRLRYFISGSAPLSPEIAEFFDGAGLPILEGYGLTETSAATFLNLPGSYRTGTVGRPMGGTEVSFAEDGEILVRNPGVMSGYHKMPEETGETLDSQGWLHTGDIGHLDDGFLTITDRKKDLIKTSGGKFVAPQRVESRYQVLCPYTSNILVHGDRRPYCVALIALDPEGIKQWARQHHLGGLDYAELVAHEKVRTMVQSYVDRLNAGLARHETIKSFALLPRELSVEHGEMTPSLKVKRRAVEHNHNDLLDGLYTGSS